MEKRETTEKPDIRTIVNHSIETAKGHIQDKINGGDNWTDSYLNTITGIGGYLQMIDGEEAKVEEIVELGNKIQKEKKHDKAGELIEPSDEEKKKFIEFLKRFKV